MALAKERRTASIWDGGASSSIPDNVASNNSSSNVFDSSITCFLSSIFQLYSFKFRSFQQAHGPVLGMKNMSDMSAADARYNRAVGVEQTGQVAFRAGNDRLFHDSTSEKM